MEPYAEATCVLNVDSKCQACKMKTMEILGSVCGVYSFDINAEEGLAKVQAVVEPNYFLKALSGTGHHAEPKWVKLQHPKANRNYYYDYDTYNGYSNGYNYGPSVYPYNHGRALPGYPYATMEHAAYPRYHGSNPYYHGSNSYYHGSGPPLARSRGPFHY